MLLCIQTVQFSFSLIILFTLSGTEKCGRTEEKNQSETVGDKVKETQKEPYEDRAREIEVR